MRRTTTGSWLTALAMVLAAAGCGGIASEEGDVGPGTDDGRDVGGDVDVPPLDDVGPADDGVEPDVTDDGAVPDDAAEIPGDGDETDAPDVPPPECGSAEDCDDREPCNGEEDCVGGSCAEGERLTDGTPCSAAGGSGSCRSGLCAPAACGDTHLDPGEECDDGNAENGDGCESNCRYSCHEHPDCDDGAPCTVETCAPNELGLACVSEPAADGVTCNDENPCTAGDSCQDGVCMPGGPRDCSDSNDCTADSCDSTIAPPANPCIHRSLHRWYLDADDDTWGNTEEMVCSDTAPSADWVARPGDCCDGNVLANPGQTAFFVAPFVCAASGSSSYDYDCDTTPERQFTTPSTGCVGADCVSCVCTEGWCPIGWPDVTGSCRGVPACGIAAGWVLYCEGVAPPITDGGTTDLGSSDGVVSDGGSSDGVLADSGGGETSLDAATDAARDGGNVCRPVLEMRTQPCH
jgi:cysteine-rich repeat protein